MAIISPKEQANRDCQEVYESTREITQERLTPDLMHNVRILPKPFEYRKLIDTVEELCTGQV